MSSPAKRQALELPQHSAAHRLATVLTVPGDTKWAVSIHHQVPPPGPGGPRGVRTWVREDFCEGVADCGGIARGCSFDMA